MAEERSSAAGTDHLNRPSTDLDRTADFYGRVFGWTIRPLEGSIECWNEDVRVGTFRLVREMPAAEPGPLPVIAVQSIDDALRTVLTLEGTVIDDKQPLEGSGWMARIADPDGNLLGLLQLRARE